MAGRSGGSWDCRSLSSGRPFASTARSALVMAHGIRRRQSPSIVADWLVPHVESHRLGRRAQSVVTISSVGLAGALGVCAIVGLAGCARKPEEPAPIPVHTATVGVRSIGTTLELSGSVVAARSARVGAVVAGRIRELRVNVGDRVTAGEPIATIDDASYRAQLEQASAGAASASKTSVAAAANVAQTDARSDLARA